MTISAAPGRTIAAGTARVLHGIRVNTADGEPAAAERPEAGVVDFVGRRVRFASTIVVGKSEYRGETLWSGARPIQQRRSRGNLASNSANKDSSARRDALRGALVASRRVMRRPE